MNVIFIIDPLETLKPEKDSTLALMAEAQNRGMQVTTASIDDLYVIEGKAYALGRITRVNLKSANWFDAQVVQRYALAEFDVLIMRKDPPFNINYIYSTYILELAQSQGVMVINDPQSLRDVNEKFIITHFPELCPPTLVTTKANLIREFIDKYKQAVLKPLAGMGGRDVFATYKGDKNLSVIIENLTRMGQKPIMCQKFLPEIKKGDKRILLIDGEPFEYALNRIPKVDELRGNLAAGASYEAVKINKKDMAICDTIAPFLREKGLFFAGIDIIGNQLSEINVTSPTCIQEIDSKANTNISAHFWDKLIKLTEHGMLSSIEKE